MLYIKFLCTLVSSIRKSIWAVKKKCASWACNTLGLSALSLPAARVSPLLKETTPNPISCYAPRKPIYRTSQTHAVYRPQPKQQKIQNIWFHTQRWRSAYWRRARRKNFLKSFVIHLALIKRPFSTGICFIDRKESSRGRTEKAKNVLALVAISKAKAKNYTFASGRWEKVLQYV